MWRVTFILALLASLMSSQVIEMTVFGTPQKQQSPVLWTGLSV